ncbi:SPOR domain-containing protein [Weeksellaceae bacterium TAE3-ERU29]|nr:SPOR domain-containing protein [Weeksellaceae bacterium TAE3-ERU29]
MKKILFLVVCLFLSFSYAQISVKDSLSGGEYNLDVNSAIDSLITKEAKANCWKAASSSSVQPEETVDICAKNPKVRGYRIQIRYTKDRNTANQVIREFNASFPDLPSEMVYTRPDYRVLVGEYFSKRSGAMDMAKIKRKYPGAFFVQWAVWCRKAK